MSITQGHTFPDLAPIFRYFGTGLIYIKMSNDQKPMTYADFCALRKSLEEKPPGDTTMILTTIRRSSDISI